MQLNFESPQDFEGKVNNFKCDIHCSRCNRCLVFPKYRLLHVMKNSLTLTSDQLLQLDLYKSRHQPPSTSIMILYCFTLCPWYFWFNSQRSDPYFVVFSSSFFFRFVTHGQLIFSMMTRFDSWLIMRVSTLLALTSWCSANRGTS